MHSRCNSDQAGGRNCSGGAHSNCRTKGKARQPEWRIRVLTAHPGQRDKRIIQLTNALVEFTLAGLGAAEIKTQNSEPHANKGPRQGVGNLVVHRASMLRVRVQHDGSPHHSSVWRRLQDGLEAPGRATEEQFFDRWRF